jgi:rare lipoprotein A
MAALVLGACAETQLAIHTAKQIVPGTGDGVPRTEGVYKVGRPYQVNGVWHYPAVDYAYAETGVASWYGPKFHGKPTANGETFDMNGVSAAHKTLPLPSVVRVINLRNGRAIRVRVNDRGPFVNGRIIDLSRRAAQLLGFEAIGTAPVRVEVIADESRRMARLAQQGRPTSTIASRREPPPPLAAVPTERVTVSSLDSRDAAAATSESGTQLAFASPSRRVAPPVGAAAGEVSVVPVDVTAALYVQAGAFVQRDYAVRLQRKLAEIAPARVVQATVGDRRFYRVRIGPVRSVEEGDRLLDRVLSSGHPGARLVVE